MPTNHYRLPAQRPAAGFSLIEILIGLAIGMLATVVIMQVLSVFEAQKSTTTGTADAQTNGSIALYNISRDMQMAGYPLMPTSGSPFNCTAFTILSPGITDVFPVLINDSDSVNGTSDSITIRYGGSGMGGVPSKITAGPVGNDVTLESNFGCQAGDLTLAIDGTNCAISTASAVAAPPATSVTLNDPTGAVDGAQLSCLGKWSEITYQVSNGTLTRRDTKDSAAFVPSVPDVVSLQAQYGVSATAASNQVTEWVDATGGTWAVPSVADRKRIKAVRVAVIARNAKMEINNVTAAVTSWTGSASDPAPTVDLSTYQDWQKYRYRVFDTIIPLRNVIWSRGVLL
ncbi:MAG: PilW family protein [Nitrosomonadales bacterium]|nr:PilW family protein [Nitrosomonadales bacterium]